VAPQGSHLRVRSRDRVELVAPAGGSHRHCPAGDVLLESLARVFGAGAAGVVLTGMGDDGAVGIAELNAAGGLAAAQDEQSSAVYGMPRAARERGVDLALAPRELGRLLARLQPLRGGRETGIPAPSVEGRTHLRVVR
jgi:two-component system chemotaxis response regulator CheB